MSAISFKTQPYKIGSWTILHVPESASRQLPSRGIVMVKGSLNGHNFRAALEPDGRGSHWFQIDQPLQKATGAKAGETATLEIEPTKDWTEPEVPADIGKALAGNQKAHETWAKITPMARREWIRWIRSTNVQETRARRIEVACSKLKSGMRRPCCFNTNLCTEPYVSKNWMLVEP